MSSLTLTFALVFTLTWFFSPAVGDEASSALTDQDLHVLDAQVTQALKPCRFQNAEHFSVRLEEAYKLFIAQEHLLSVRIGRSHLKLASV
jgi:hypothetical protein